MTEAEGRERDLAALVVARVGCLEATGSLWEPYRLVGPDGQAVWAVSEYLRELQAAGRSQATQRSYGMDLLRWLRFLWAVRVPWDQATRAEARDFSRWVQVGGKPTAPHWRRAGSGSRGGPPVPAVASIPNQVTGKAAPGPKYAAATAAHSESVLRGFTTSISRPGPGRW